MHACDDVHVCAVMLAMVCMHVVLVSTVLRCCCAYQYATVCDVGKGTQKYLKGGTKPPKIGSF